MRKATFTFLLFVNAVCLSSVEAQTVTELIRSGGNGSKKNLVIIGDGFRAGDQPTYNDFVKQFVMEGVFAEGVFNEDMNAFNIYRVNINSRDSGVTQVDEDGDVTTGRNTALGYRYSGRWGRCWMEPGPNTAARTAAVLTLLVPQWDYVFVVLNEPNGGGCRRGSTLAVTSAGSWPTGSHEMGHLVGNLGDEYDGDEDYTGGEPGRANQTINRRRATLKWRAFVDPSTSLPTTSPDDTNQQAGLFAGATTGGKKYGTGIFRPVSSCRMDSNSKKFCPVCYNRIQEVLDPFHAYNYNESYTGDFNGDGRADVVLHNANSLALYTSNGSRLVPAWIATGKIPLWDDFKAGDKFYVGDFDADGKDDLFVVNFRDWSMPYFALLRSTGSGFECVRRFDRELPGWDDMRGNDQFFVADFNADKRDDIYVFNGQDWSMGYLGMLRSNGTNLLFTRRFDDTLPGWGEMRRNDQFYVGDFDADGRRDLYVFNGRDWSMGYLEMLSSTGSNLRFVRRFDDTLPGWDEMRRNDKFYVADFDGNRREDLYVFNGHDWSSEYLEMLRSNGTSLVNARRFDDDVPGWGGLAPEDQFFVGDINGDGRSDLYAYNASDWATEYLGVLHSSGSNLSGSWQDDWVNSWNLGRNDRFLVGNFNGGAGWDDLFVRNADWFGTLQSYNTAVGLTAIDPKWIHDHRFHSSSWW
jgi:hypothetical protein